MRLKHARQRRKLLTYFRAAHGFRPPFKVLVDGMSIQAAINHGVALADTLPQLLGDKVKLLVPKAAVAELHALGRNFSAAAKFARRLQVVVPAENGGTASAAGASAAAEALVALVDGGNPSHHFVLTEDVELRQRLAGMPGVPLLRFARGRLVLEAPSRHGGQHGGADDAADWLAPMPEGPTTGGKRPRPTQAGGVGGAARSDVGGPVGGDALDSGGTERERKRRRVKEPNPLSVKKKKKKAGEQAAKSHHANAVGGNEAGAPAAGKRRRRHGRQQKESPETAGTDAS